MIRNIHGSFIPYGLDSNAYGVCHSIPGYADYSADLRYGLGSAVDIETSRVVPTGAANKPRAWGALACAYLGIPAS